ncbi:hypothetical protein JHK85_040919 [Glycine max]|nr:hypothetical protein JHK85_040919 [Glycine max]
MKKLARKLHNEEDEHLSLLVHDRDSHSLDPQAVSRLLHGGDLLVDDYICMFTSLIVNGPNALTFLSFQKQEIVNGFSTFTGSGCKPLVCLLKRPVLLSLDFQDRSIRDYSSCTLVGVPLAGAGRNTTAAWGWPAAGNRRTAITSRFSLCASRYSFALDPSSDLLNWGPWGVSWRMESLCRRRSR